MNENKNAPDEFVLLRDFIASAKFGYYTQEDGDGYLGYEDQASNISVWSGYDWHDNDMGYTHVYWYNRES